MEAADEMEGAAALLEASGRYRILRRLEPRSVNEAPDGSPAHRAVFLDVETTGLDPAADEIVELAMVPYDFAPDGRVFAVHGCFDRLRGSGAWRWRATSPTFAAAGFANLLRSFRPAVREGVIDHGGFQRPKPKAPAGTIFSNERHPWPPRPKRRKPLPKSPTKRQTGPSPLIRPCRNGCDRGPIPNNEENPK